MSESVDKFAAFQQKHPLYERAYRFLAERSPLLATSAKTVYEMQGNKLGAIAEDILGYLDSRGIEDCLEIYLKRLDKLMELQERFDREPSVKTLHDPTMLVDRDAYDLSLLLSIILCNHRFEIISQLKNFLDSIYKPSGRIVSIGAGTGYELKLMAKKLKGWTIEGYDTDAGARATASNLNEFFHTSSALSFGAEFPLQAPTEETRERFDAIVICEVLEHLENPEQALNTLRQCLKPGGYIFLTMAINIAQEDHIYWYPDIPTCRTQLKDIRLTPVFEWIAPVTINAIPDRADREKDFRTGNYIAVVS
jgi:2-polyprenyl-3-methyl-5-hydroxy-6-metoxy-1,4-benzoquinol methylase